MKMKIGTINNIVNEINSDSLEKFNNDFLIIELRSIGDIIGIEFLGICIWNSEESEDTCIDLKQHLINEMDDIILSFQNIVF